MSVRPSVRLSVRPSVKHYFLTIEIKVFEVGKSTDDMINNIVMSDEEEVASDVPRGTCFRFASGTPCGRLHRSFIFDFRSRFISTHEGPPHDPAASIWSGVEEAERRELARISGQSPYSHDVTDVLQVSVTSVSPYLLSHT